MLQHWLHESHGDGRVLGFDLGSSGLGLFARQPMRSLHLEVRDMQSLGIHLNYLCSGDFRVDWVRTFKGQRKNKDAPKVWRLKTIQRQNWQRSEVFLGGEHNCSPAQSSGGENRLAIFVRFSARKVFCDFVEISLPDCWLWALDWKEGNKCSHEATEWLDMSWGTDSVIHHLCECHGIYINVDRYRQHI